MTTPERRAERRAWHDSQPYVIRDGKPKRPGDSLGTVVMIIAAVIGIAFVVVALDDKVGSPPTNNEPYVGHCIEPSVQLGC